MEKTVHICDTCGAMATACLRFRVNGKSYETDRCAACLADELKIARPAKRGGRRTGYAST